MDNEKISNKNKYKSKRNKSSGKITSIDSVKKKAKAKSQKHKTKANVYYSFLL